MATPSSGSWSLSLPSRSRRTLAPLLRIFPTLALSFSAWQAHRIGHRGIALLLGASALLWAGLATRRRLPLLWRRWDSGTSSEPIRQGARLTTRGGLFLLTTGGIAFASLNSGNNLLILVLSVLLAGLIVSGMAAKAVLRNIKVSLSLPKDIHATRPVVFYLKVSNLKTRIPSFALAVDGRFGNSKGREALIQATRFPHIAPQGHETRRLTCRFPERGIYSVDGIRLETSFPFGFFRRRRGLPMGGQLVVYPELCDLGHLFRAHPPLEEGRRESRHRGSGGALYNIRPYRSGDRARFVHWKSTAKLNRMMVKDFAREEDRPLHLYFSTRLPSDGRRERRAFERAVSLVASLARHYRKRRRSLVLQTEDVELISRGRHEEHACVMQYLAQVQPVYGRRAHGPTSGWGVLLTASGEAAAEGFVVVNYLRDDLLRRQEAGP